MNHRDKVGGKWDEIGNLQFDFLRKWGLQPDHNVLDIGCGSLRLGSRLIPYLEEGRYTGYDHDRKLVEEGIAGELNHDTRGSRFIYSDEWDFGCIEKDTVAIAHSLFTHCNMNDIIMCFRKLPTLVRCFYATFFLVEEEEWERVHRWPDNISTYPNRDAYHYTVDMVSGMMRLVPSRFGGWDFAKVDYDHPRGQSMLRFTHGLY